MNTSIFPPSYLKELRLILLTFPALGSSNVVSTIYLLEKHIYFLFLLLATFRIFRDLILTLLTFPAQGSSNDVYSPILLNFYFVIPLSLSKILTIYLFQRSYEVGWPLLFFILVALFPHLNIANPSSFLRFLMTKNLFTFQK